MMSNRNKIIIGLLTVTLALGVFIFMRWMDNDDSIYRFRMLLLQNPRQLLDELWVTSGDAAGLWYGAIALGAIAITGLALTTLNSAERRIFRERLVAMEVAKAEVETSLQDSLWREKHARGAKEAAAKELKEITDRFLTIQRQLIETEKTARRHERDLKMLRSQSGAAVTGPQETNQNVLAEERGLREELDEKTRLLEAKDSALKQAQEKFTERVSGLQSQLGAKDGLLKKREQELQTVRAQIASLEAAKNKAETTLAEELKREKQAARAKESTQKAEAQSLQAQLIEKQNLLKGSAAERERLAAELESLTAQISEKTATGERLEKLLQQELEKNRLLLRQDLQLKQLASDLKGRVGALQSQLGDKEALLKGHVSESDLLKRELAAHEAAKNRSEAALQMELAEAKEALQSLDASTRKREQQLGQRIERLEGQLKERDNLVARRDGDLAALKTEIAGLAAQLSGKNAQAAANQEASPLVKQLEKKLAETVSAMKSELSAKAMLVEEHEQDLQTLKAQLANMEAAKSQLATSLAGELEKERQASLGKDAAIQELERKFSDQLRALNAQLHSKQELLQAGAAEQEKLRAELQALVSRLGETTADAERMEKLLQQEIEKASQAARAKDAALKRLDGDLHARIGALESQLSERDAAFNERGAELTTLKAELAELQAARVKDEESLRHELRKLTETLHAKELSMSELEGRLSESVNELELRLRERESLLNSREGEIANLKSEIARLSDRLAATAATQQVRALPRPESSVSPQALENSLKKIKDLEFLLADKDELLKTHDEKLSRLEAELKDKRTALARHEISVWQGIERRDLWKRRLSKVGIRLRD